MYLLVMGALWKGSPMNPHLWRVLRNSVSWYASMMTTASPLTVKSKTGLPTILRNDSEPMAGMYWKMLMDMMQKQCPEPSRWRSRNQAFRVLSVCKTSIGYGAPNKAGTASAHGSPLGDDEVANARIRLAWDSAPFEIPDDIRSAWDCRQAGAEKESNWRQQFAEYTQRFPQLAMELERTLASELPEAWSEHMDALLRKVSEEGEKIASRNASGNVISEVASLMPELIGGSADLFWFQLYSVARVNARVG